MATPEIDSIEVAADHQFHQLSNNNGTNKEEKRIPRLSPTQESILWFFVDENKPLDPRFFAKGIGIDETTVRIAISVLNKHGFSIEKVDGNGYLLAEEQKEIALQVLIVQPWGVEGNVDGQRLKLKSSERELVNRAIEHDQEALAGLYALYFPRVYRYILARTGNSFDAEDITGEVFIKVLEAIDRFEWREAPFSAWLFRIAHNAVISQRRKDGARGRSAPLNDNSTHLAIATCSVEDRVENRIQIEEIQLYIDRLPEAYRQVMSLRFMAGLSVAETATAMNKGKGNIKVIQHKAMKKLREMAATPNETEFKTTQQFRLSDLYPENP